MRQYERPLIGFAICLSTLAGFVDALGFIGMGGFFVSFMSGNSTRLGVGMAQGLGPVAELAAGLIGMFVAGVVLGSLVGRHVGPWRRKMILLLVGSLLLLAAISPWGTLSKMLLLAAAMGCENTVFERDGEVSIGVTYMTGTLVKLGQHLATALSGGTRFGWARYLLLWMGLVAGGVAGAISHALFSLSAIWIAGAAALILAIVAPRDHSGTSI